MENPFFRQASISTPTQEPIKHLHIPKDTYINLSDEGLDAPSSIHILFRDVGVTELLRKFLVGLPWLRGAC